MFKHILLPTDGSDVSLRGVKLGIELASSFGARVHALHVIPPYYSHTYLADMLTATEATYMEAAVERAEKCLAEVRDLAAEAGVVCDSIHVTGESPSDCIVQEARRCMCDLIVMASHGWRGVTKLLLGSETQRVLQTSHVPVLVCR